MDVVANPDKKPTESNDIDIMFDPFVEAASLTSLVLPRKFNIMPAGSNSLSPLVTLDFSPWPIFALPENHQAIQGAAQFLLRLVTTNGAIGSDIRELNTRLANAEAIKQKTTKAIESFNIVQQRLNDSANKALPVPADAFVGIDSLWNGLVDIAHAFTYVFVDSDQILMVARDHSKELDVKATHIAFGLPEEEARFMGEFFISLLYSRGGLNADLYDKLLGRIANGITFGDREHWLDKLVAYAKKNPPKISGYENADSDKYGLLLAIIDRMHAPQDADRKARYNERIQSVKTTVTNAVLPSMAATAFDSQKTTHYNTSIKEHMARNVDAMVRELLTGNNAPQEIVALRKKWLDLVKTQATQTYLERAKANPMVQQYTAAQKTVEQVEWQLAMYPRAKTDATRLQPSHFNERRDAFKEMDGFYGKTFDLSIKQLPVVADGLIKARKEIGYDSDKDVIVGGLEKKVEKAFGRKVDGTAIVDSGDWLGRSGFMFALRPHNGLNGADDILTFAKVASGFTFKPK